MLASFAVCEHCNTLFVRAHHAKRFCSPVCARKTYDKLVVRQRYKFGDYGIATCPGCGEDFTKHVESQRYCGRGCASNNPQAMWRQPQTCANCGEVFYRAWKQRCCSKRCNVQMPDWKERVCPPKGVPFLPREMIEQLAENARGKPRPFSVKAKMSVSIRRYYAEHYEEAATRWKNCNTSALEDRVADSLTEYGFKYATQVRISRFFVDFLFEREHLAVEIDGCYWHACRQCGFDSKASQQRVLRDAQREERIVSKGYTVLHFWEHDLMRDIDIVARTLIERGVQREGDGRAAV